MADNHSENNWLEFRPRPSNGRRWTFAIGFGALILCVAPFVITSVLGELPWIVTGAFIFIGFAVSSPILVVAWLFPRMRYLIDDREIALQLEPVMDDRIRIEDIRRIRVKDELKISWLASFRFPGFSIMDVEYIDENRVRMCATAASHRIMLIDTDRKRFGITPDDEAGFLDELRRRISDPTVIEIDAE